MKKIKLTKGKYAIVDDDDYDFVLRLDPVLFHRIGYNGHKVASLGRQGEVILRSQGNGGGTYYVKNFLIKRTITKNGSTVVVCRNGNNLDLRKENLVCIPRGISIHTNKKRKNTSSKYKGVVFIKRGKLIKRWYACIKDYKTGKQIGLGMHMTEKEAAIVYNKKAKELYGGYAYQNKID